MFLTVCCIVTEVMPSQLLEREANNGDRSVTQFHVCTLVVSFLSALRVRRAESCLSTTGPNTAMLFLDLISAALVKVFMLHPCCTELRGLRVNPRKGAELRGLVK